MRSDNFVKAKGHGELGGCHGVVGGSRGAERVSRGAKRVSRGSGLVSRGGGCVSRGIWRVSRVRQGGSLLLVGEGCLGAGGVPSSTGAAVTRSRKASSWRSDSALWSVSSGRMAGTPPNPSSAAVDPPLT